MESRSHGASAPDMTTGPAGDGAPENVLPQAWCESQRCLIPDEHRSRSAVTDGSSTREGRGDLEPKDSLPPR